MCVWLSERYDSVGLVDSKPCGIHRYEWSKHMEGGRTLHRIGQWEGVKSEAFCSTGCWRSGCGVLPPKRITTFFAGNVRLDVCIQCCYSVILGRQKKPERIWLKTPPMPIVPPKNILSVTPPPKGKLPRPPRPSSKALGPHSRNSVIHFKDPPEVINGGRNSLGTSPGRLRAVPPLHGVVVRRPQRLRPADEGRHQQQQRGVRLVEVGPPPGLSPGSPPPPPPVRSAKANFGQTPPRQGSWSVLRGPRPPPDNRVAREGLVGVRMDIDIGIRGGPNEFGYIDTPISPI